MLSYFIFSSAHVIDAAPSVAGAPGAPMSVKAYDVNSDYVLVAWKPPNTVNEAAITGYFVDRSVCTPTRQQTREAVARWCEANHCHSQKVLQFPPGSPVSSNTRNTKLH